MLSRNELGGISVTHTSKHEDHHHCDPDYHGVACVIGPIGRVSGIMPGAGLPCLVCVGGLWGFRVGSYRVCEGRRRRGEGERLGLGEGCGEGEFEEEVEEEEQGEEAKELLRERVRVGWDEIWHTLHICIMCHQWRSLSIEQQYSNCVRTWSSLEALVPVSPLEMSPDLA